MKTEEKVIIGIIAGSIGLIVLSKITRGGQPTQPTQQYKYLIKKGQDNISRAINGDTGNVDYVGIVGNDTSVFQNSLNEGGLINVSEGIYATNSISYPDRTTRLLGAGIGLTRINLLSPTSKINIKMGKYQELKDMTLDAQNFAITDGMIDCSLPSSKVTSHIIDRVRLENSYNSLGINATNNEELKLLHSEIRAKTAYKCQGQNGFQYITDTFFTSTEKGLDLQGAMFKIDGAVFTGDPSIAHIYLKHADQVNIMNTWFEGATTGIYGDLTDPPDFVNIAGGTRFFEPTNYPCIAGKIKNLSIGQAYFSANLQTIDATINNMTAFGTDFWRPPNYSKITRYYVINSDGTINKYP